MFKYKEDEMKIGVMSDSHDNLDKIRTAVAVFVDRKVEVLLHAGDFCSPFVFREMEQLKERKVKMYGVFGNNDGDRVLLVKNAGDFCTLRDGIMKLELDGRKIALMHYPDAAEDMFASGNYDLVVYGHTHREVIKGGDKRLLNPGATSGYLVDRATVAIVDLSDLSIEIVAI